MDAFAHIAEFQLPQEYEKYFKQSDFILEVDYHLKCDENWKGKGKTIFSKERYFHDSVFLQKKDNVSDEK